MKTLLKVAIMLCLIANLSTRINAQQFAVKSGYIEYELTGNTTGTKKIWWTNYGVNSYTETESVSRMKIFGITSETNEHIISIMKGEYFWSANLEEGTGQKGKNPYYQMGKYFAESLSETETKQLEQQIMDAFNAEKIGTENILGNNCDIISVMGTKSWIYKGVILKSEANVMGVRAVERAIKFNENISVPVSKFTPYEGVTYTDIQEMEALYNGNDNYSDNEDNDTPTTPVNYPFEKFKSTVGKCTIDGYTNRATNSIEGQHFAMFIQATNSITIAATSKENAESNEVSSNLEEFNYKGHKCMFGILDEDEGTALIVDYPTYNMYIIIAASNHKTKEELLKINNNLNF